MSKDSHDEGISMDEIDRKIDEMPVFDLRDPKARKQTKIDIGEIVDSLDLESLVPAQPTEPDSQARDED